MAFGQIESLELEESFHPKAQNLFSFCLRQLMGWVAYVSLTLVVLVLSMLYVVCMCFIVIPIAALTCKFRELPSFYHAPVRLQAELFRKYKFKFNFRKAEWDLEKSKPQPLPRLRRRTLSTSSNIVPQQKSALFSKLPTEIRLQIYRYVLAGDRNHIHIAVHRTQDGKRLTSRLHGFACQDISCMPARDCKCFNLRHHCRPLPYCKGPSPEEIGRGDLALVKTCRQVYVEAINLLYSDQIFYFTTLSHPPFFLQSFVPERLSQITHIQLCYNQRIINKTCYFSNTQSSLFTRAARREHKFQQCSSCNLNRWLDTIGKAMPNLKRVQTFLYLEKSCRIPTVIDPWILKLFKLQIGPNGLRDLEIEVFPGVGDTLAMPWAALIAPLAPLMYDASADRLRIRLQEMIQSRRKMHLKRTNPERVVEEDAEVEG